MQRHLFISVLSLFFYIGGYGCMEIIGGNEAVPHSRPYMAYITTQNGKNTKSSCGGALIKPNWVLTAAHCLLGNETKVILGAHSLTKNSSPQNQQQFRIKRAIQHPCYDRELKVHDIQVVQLEKPAKLNKFVSVLCLPEKEENIKPGAICSVAGWGVTDYKRQIPSDVLRQANLTIVDNIKCNKFYIKQEKTKITSSMICAGPLKGRNDDACWGDSGGPLICNNKYTGIVSFGPKKCGKQKIPGVYTRLTDQYLKWIKDMTGGAFY